MLDPFPSFLFHATADDTKLTAADWNDNLPAPLRQEGCCLAIWQKQLITQVMSPRPASTSAVSTRRSFTPRGEAASTSRMTLPPVAASEHSDGFHQQAAASSHPQPVPGSVVNAWLSADMWPSTRILRCRHMKRLLNCCTPMDSILEDKELMKMHVDLPKRFPIYQMYPKYLAALLCVAAIRKKASTSLLGQDV